MKKQTFILSVWCGAENYRDAEPESRDFYRLSCKKVETAKRYLRGYVKEANDPRKDTCYYKFMYPFFFAEDGRYMIENTPDGYNVESVVASGFIKDLYSVNG